jgi:hypothetical protein
MSKRLLSRLLGMFQSRTQVGIDKAGNRYFTRVEEVDGASTCPPPSTPLILSPASPFLHELASSFPAPGLLWGGGRHVNAG